jgi:hypothetical protein
VATPKGPTCACGCGKALPPRTGPGRPAKYLAEHAPDKRQGRRSRRAELPAVPTEGLASVTPLAGSRPAPTEPALVAATRAELAAVDRDVTPEGIIVLQLAWQISAGGGTQAGLAALVREFHASKARALDGADEVGDPVVEIFGS